MKQIRNLLEIVGKRTEIVRWDAVVEKIARQTLTVLHFNLRNVKVAALLDVVERRCPIFSPH